MTSKKLTAIDLYSGVGGWSLGLSLAGIRVISSYEWWAPANVSNEVNNGHPTHLSNVREVASSGSAKQKVDIVVGSPPCTQFSFSNRGGGGDIAEGFMDLAAFFEIVAQCQPKWWAMENVPRVAELLPAAIQRGKPLYKYRDLISEATIQVVNCADYGVPQARKRCIAGNFDFSLLNSYAARMPKRTLGDVIGALGKATLIDPVYGIRMPRSEVTDHEKESVLTAEEERLNRESKTFHPVYNSMAFPEKEAAAARTVTATCTRVSRESLVIADKSLAGYRRLTIRERASLQSFPINYQFMGSSSSEKMKLVGNAIPPLLTFLIGEAMQARKSPTLTNLKNVEKVNAGGLKAPVTPAEKPVGRYRADRNFRLALPSLRFKSGMRFELSNSALPVLEKWLVSFFHGNSKDIHVVTPDQTTLLLLTSGISTALAGVLKKAHDEARGVSKKIDARNLQDVWTCRSKGTHPFEVVDQLGAIAERAIEKAAAAVNSSGSSQSSFYAAFSTVFGTSDSVSAKLRKNAVEVAVGLCIASGFNGG